MPSKTKKQADFMKAVAHSPEFAKKAGIPQKVGKDFAAADKAKAKPKKKRNYCWTVTYSVTAALWQQKMMKSVLQNTILINF